MKLYEPSIVCRTLPGKGRQPLFWAAVPKYMFGVINCAPGKNQDADSIVWLRLAEFDVPEPANRFRWIIFPFRPPERVGGLFRVRARMVNKRGAMFVVSWLLEELCGLRFRSSSGIDASDECGIADAILEIDPTAVDTLYQRTHPGPDRIANYARFLHEELLRVDANDLGDAPRLREVVSIALRRAIPDTDVTRLQNDTFESAAALWRRFYPKLAEPNGHPLNFFPTFFPGPHCAAPASVAPQSETTKATDAETLTAEGQHLHPLLRLEPCFQQKECAAIGEDEPHAVAVQTWDDADSPCATLADDYYRICLPVTPLSKFSPYLPADVGTFTNTAVGLDPPSGTISIHLKPKTEVYRNIAVRFPARDGGQGISPFVLDLYESGLDLRALADAYSANRANKPCHTVGFAADVAKSDLRLTLFDDAVACAILRSNTKFLAVPGRDNLRVVTPCGVSPDMPRMAIECICVSKNSDSDDCQIGLCKQRRRAAITKEDKLIHEAVDKDRKVMTLRCGDVWASASVAGIGRECAGLMEELAESYQFASPLVSIIAQGLFDAAGKPELNRAAQRELMAASIAEHMLPKKARAVGILENGLKPDETAQFQEVGTGKNKKYDFTSLGVLGEGQNGRVYRIRVDGGFEDHDEFALKTFSLQKLAREWPFNGAPGNTGPDIMRIVRLSGKRNLPPFAVLMTYLEGFDLNDVLAKRAHFPRLSDVIGWLGRAMEIARLWEKNNVIHWDIKPGNLFLPMGGDRRLRILDIGLAGQLTGGKQGTCLANTELPKEEIPNLFGSTYHVAREIQQLRPTSAATMVYSLSALVCNMLGDKNALLSGKPGPRLPQWTKTLFGQMFDQTMEKALKTAPKSRPPVQDMIDAVKDAKRTLSFK